MDSTRDWPAELLHWLDCEDRLVIDSSSFPPHLIAAAVELLPDDMDDRADDADAVVREFHDAIASVLQCNDWPRLTGRESARLIAAAAIFWAHSPAEVADAINIPLGR